MKIHQASLTANVARHIPLPGRYFRILNGSGIFEVEFSNGVRTDFVAGLGVELSDFDSLMIVSPTDQVVLVAVSNLPIDDNRLSGDVALSGTIDTKQAGAATNQYGAQVVGAVATLIADVTAARRSLLIQNLGSVDIYVGSSAAVTTASGVRVSGNGGTYETQAVGAVYAITAAGSSDVRFSEDVN
jgi:hypothetical protein